MSATDAASASTSAAAAAAATPAAAAAAAVSYPIANPPLSVEEAKAEALRQFEFYFSNANLPFDKFLFKLTRTDNDPPLTDDATGEEIPPGPGQGWVPINTLATFKRMQPMRQSLSDAQLADALETSPLFKLDPSRTKLRRKEPIRPSKDAFQRSIYAKGFPDETPTLQSELEKYFSGFGNVVVVRMRRDESVRPPKFKNSVFVEFAENEEKDAFLKLDPKPKYNDVELLTMSKEDYCNMKMKEKGIDPSERGHKKEDGEDSKAGEAKENGSGAGLGSNNSKKRKFNAFTELRREAMGLPNQLDEDKPRKERAPKQTPEEKEAARIARRAEPLEFPFVGLTLKTKADGTVDEEGIEFPVNSVLKFENGGVADKNSWKLLKDAVSVVQQPFFVDLAVGKSAGSIGFNESVSEEALAKIKALNVPIAGKAGEKIVWSRPTPEESHKSWLTRANFRASMMLDRREEDAAGGNDSGRFRGGGGHRGGGSRDRRGGRGGGGRGGRGGRGGGGGRFRDRDGGQAKAEVKEEGETGQKRKRQDADAGAAGLKLSEGARPPSIGVKKAKTEDA